jgi:cytochrome P450
VLLMEMNAVRFDPLQPDVIADPYPSYRALRESDPVHWGVAGDAHWPGTWYLLAHDDVVPALKDPRLGREVWRVLPAFEPSAQPLDAMKANWMILRDPPQHARLRSVVVKAFTPRVVEKMLPRIDQLADEVLAPWMQRGRMDVIADFARVLPVMVIAEMLGVPANERHLFSPHAVTLASAIEWKQDDAVKARCMDALAQLTAYVMDLFARRRRDPQDDLISALLQANERNALSDAELFGNVTILLVAGNDPTMHLIGNAMHALLRQAEKLHELRAQPALLENAVDELLRYDSSVQMTFRYALEDMVIRDKHIRAGDHVALVFGSALRDPAYCDAPDEIRFDRANNWLPFGGGIHFCPGNMLAREIGIASLRRLIALPDLRLATQQSEWQDTVAVRGLRSLPVLF